MRTALLVGAVGLAVLLTVGVTMAQERQPAPRPEAGPLPPGPPDADAHPMPPGPKAGAQGDPMDDKDVRELIETVRMVRLSKELGLNKEETVILIRQYEKFKERAQELSRERQRLLRDLRDTVRANASDEEIQAALDKLMAKDEEVFTARRDALRAVGKDLTPKQRAKLYVFMGEFDQEMRQLIQKAREAGGGRFMRMRENMLNPPGPQDGPPPEPGMGPDRARPPMVRPTRPVDRIEQRLRANPPEREREEAPPAQP